MILYARDVKPEFDNDEPQAYLAEATYDQMIRWLEDMKMLKYIKKYVA